MSNKPHDSVNHPKHYTTHPSGVECIQVTEHMTFCLGNAVKYIWRAGEKGDAIEDLKKAIWYIEREIQRIKEGRKPVYKFITHGIYDNRNTMCRELWNEGKMVKSWSGSCIPNDGPAGGPWGTYPDLQNTNHANR